MSDNTRHLINVALLVAIVTYVVIMILENTPLFPVQASAEGLPVDWLFGLHLRVIAFLFALIVVFVLYSVIAFRRKPGETGDGDYFHGNTTLEIFWTILPLATVLYFSYLGAVTLADITSPAKDEMVVNVTASQWKWRFEYPDSGVTTSELALPLGRTVHLQLESSDVIHDFWVPEFRVKQDAVPGMVKSLRVTPTRVGEYKVRCAEICGSGHADMRAPVKVMPADEFDAWLSAKEEELALLEAGPAIERGKHVAELMGCQECHSLDGSPGKAPTWKGLYGKEETLADGTTVTVDEAYIHESIVTPGAKIVKGFGNSMPPRFG
ncbi:MAG: cytochrome c oxidase subunit II, partial [Caldilineae bacterium]